MKKFLMMAVIAMAGVAANAQVWVGGAVGYDHVKQNGVKDSYITVSPEVGYNLDNDWAIALDLNYGLRTGDQKTRNSLSLTPYMRYTFFRSGIASLFVDGGFNVGTVKVDGQDSQTTWGVGFRPGLAVALSSKLSLVTKVGYLGYQKNDLDNSDRFGFGVNNENLTFGLYYNF